MQNHTSKKFWTWHKFTAKSFKRKENSYFQFVINIPCSFFVKIASDGEVQLVVIVVYSFIAITLKSTLTRSGSIWVK